MQAFMRTASDVNLTRILSVLLDPFALNHDFHFVTSFMHVHIGFWVQKFHSFKLAASAFGDDVFL